MDEDAKCDWLMARMGAGSGFSWDIYYGHAFVVASADLIVFEKDSVCVFCDSYGGMTHSAHCLIYETGADVDYYNQL